MEKEFLKNIELKISNKLKEIEVIKAEIKKINQDKYDFIKNTITNFLYENGFEFKIKIQEEYYLDHPYTIGVYFNKIWRDSSIHPKERMLSIYVREDDYISMASYSNTKYWEKVPEVEKFLSLSDNYLSAIKNEILKLEKWNSTRVDEAYKNSPTSERLLYKEGCETL